MARAIPRHAQGGKAGQPLGTAQQRLARAGDGQASRPSAQATLLRHRFPSLETMLVYRLCERVRSPVLGLHVGVSDGAAASGVPLLQEVLIPPWSTMIGCVRELDKPAKFMGWIVRIQNMDF